MKNKTKSVFSVLLVLLVLSPIFASTKLASTNDGSIYLLKDNNTYEKFVPKSYDSDMGYEAVDTTQTTFGNQSWDKISLTALGNYLPTVGYNKLGSYTSGEYFLLQMKKDISTRERVVLQNHVIPSIKLDDGTTIQGTNERFQTAASSSVVGWYTNRTSSKSITYSVLYNIPEGRTPVAVVFTDSDNSTQTCDLGSYKAL
jgi:hypothetical protein